MLGRSALESAQEPLLAVFISLGIFLALDRFSMASTTVIMLVLVSARLATTIGDTLDRLNGPRRQTSATR